MDENILGAAMYSRYFSSGATVLLLLAVVAPSPLLALENGRSVYPYGAESYLVGVIPPEGTYVLQYDLLYSANRFNGSNGQPLFSQFHTDAVVRGASHRSHFRTGLSSEGTPFVAGLGVFSHISGEVNDGAQGNDTGLAEVDLTQGIGWHYGKYIHFGTGVDEYIPTIRYDPSQLINVGFGHSAIEPVFALTYFDPTGFTGNLKVMYDFNQTNPTTNYKGGEDFHFDYSVGYTINHFTFGAGGYYDRQTTDDMQNGAIVGPDGFKSRGFALGPEFQYDFNHNLIKFFFEHELQAENKTMGNNFWINGVFPLAGVF